MHTHGQTTNQEINTSTLTVRPDASRLWLFNYIKCVFVRGIFKYLKVYRVTKWQVPWPSTVQTWNPGEVTGRTAIHTPLIEQNGRPGPTRPR